MEQLIKYFFLIVSSFYFYHKVLNLKSNTIYFIKAFILAIFVGLEVYLLPTDFLVPFFIVFGIFVSSLFLYNHDCQTTFCLSVISVSISYFTSICSLFILSPILGLFYYKWHSTTLLSIIQCFMVGIGSLAILVFFFHLKRFKNGIPNIGKYLSQNFCLYGSIIILLIQTLFYLANTNTLLDTFLSIFVLILGISMYSYISSYISTRYLIKSKDKNIQRLEDIIQSQQIELEKLSSLIHKDNKFIAALELSVIQSQCGKTELSRELSDLLAERNNHLANYEREHILSQTGIFSIDITLNYFAKCALEKNILFDVSCPKDLKYLVQNLIDEHDLNTLVADLLENAFIATSTCSTRKVMFTAGINEYFFFSLYDSGLPFDIKVLEHLGKERYTTHSDSGGSGIGLMTTCELLKKYKASFVIEELNNTSFRKSVSVYFDSKAQIRVSSVRSEVFDACKYREDIIVNKG